MRYLLQHLWGKGKNSGHVLSIATSVGKGKNVIVPDYPLH